MTTGIYEAPSLKVHHFAADGAKTEVVTTQDEELLARFRSIFMRFRPSFREALVNQLENNLSRLELRQPDQGA